MKLNRKIILLSVMLVAFILIIISCKPVYKDASKPVEDRISDLLSKMTLEEKVSMLSGDSSGFDTKGIARLGIPAIHLSDGPLGVRTGNATSFPAGVLMAASWDTSLINEVAKAMAEETKAKGKSYLLGPCVCIQRFPFGGRNFESYSEDPFLASRMAVNWVKGLQSENVMASVKHFAMNDQEFERNNYNVVADERTMREIHLPAFEAAVKEGGAWSVMSAYNIVNGHHCSENKHLLTDILKNDWGFKGFVVSDWVSVYSTVNAANAGLDLEMPVGIHFAKDSLLQAIKDGKITEETINDKVSRLLRAMFSIGLFDGERIADTTVLHSDAHKQLTLKAAESGIVLLKNQNNILPLDNSKLKSIAVIGPNSDVCQSGGGGSSLVIPYYKVSPLEGITKRAGNSIKINFAKGANIDLPKVYPIEQQFLFTPDKKENGLKAEYYNNTNLTGDPVLIKSEKLINNNWGMGSPDSKVNKDFFSIRYTGWLKIQKTKTCKLYTISDDGVRLYINDKLIINDWTQHGSTYDFAKYTFEANKDYKIKVEFFDNSGEAVLKLGWTYDQPDESEEFLQEAVQKAKESDVAVIFAGLSATYESEGLDPAKMDLPGDEEELIKAVAKVNPNTIVVLNGGISLEVAPWINNVKGLIDMFYSGQETGNAIASILFGDVNPSGKLPFTFLKNPEQSPVWKQYNSKDLTVKYDEGVFVGYRYYDINKVEPEYPFGYGLSYTTFEYSNIKSTELNNRTFEVSFDVKNTGKVKGDEVSELYISQEKPSVPRPIKELKGFSKVSLNPGETKTVTIKIIERDFAYWSPDSNGWKVDTGKYDIMVGSNSRQIYLNSIIDLK